MNWHPLPYWQHSAWQTTTEIYSFQRLYHASHFCSTTLGSPKLFECSVTRMWAMPMDCETFPKFRFRRTATLNDSSIPVQSQLSECGFPSGAFHIWRIMGCSRTAGATSSRDDLKDGSTCPWYLDISSTYFLPIFTYDISDSFSPILSRGAGRSSVLVVFFWCTGILWACYHQPSLNHDLKKFLQELKLGTSNQLIESFTVFRIPWYGYVTLLDTQYNLGVGWTQRTFQRWFSHADPNH